LLLKRPKAQPKSKPCNRCFGQKWLFSCSKFTAGLGLLLAAVEGSF
jgi:hypothetical protein